MKVDERGSFIQNFANATVVRSFAVLNNTLCFKTMNGQSLVCLEMRFCGDDYRLCEVTWRSCDAGIARKKMINEVVELFNLYT